MRIADANKDSKSESLTELTAQVECFVRQSAAEGCTLRDFERTFLDRLLHIGRVGMDLFLASQGDGDRGETVTESDGSVLHRGEQPEARPLRTIFGRHQFQAFVYRQRQHPNTAIQLRPIDERLGIEPHRWSPLLQEFSMLFSVEQSFAPAAKAFDTIFRQSLSVDTLEQVSRQMGERAGLFLDGLTTPPADEEGEILVLTSDGKGIPMVHADAVRLRTFDEKSLRPGNRRMATLASVYSVDPHYRTADEIMAALFRDDREDDAKDHQTRPKPCHKRVVAHLPRVVEETGESKPISGMTLALSWATREVQSRHCDGQILVRLMDGQHSLWDTADLCGCDVRSELTVDILDILHVASYVWRAAKAFHPHREQQEAFARERLQRILEGEAKGVITGLRRMAKQRKLQGDSLKEVHTVCGYFSSHLHRMKYDEYLSGGYPIATGVIEGACRHLVKDRMERSGMRWTGEGAQAMLNLRALYQSSYWDSFQQSHHAEKQPKAPLMA